MPPDPGDVVGHGLTARVPAGVPIELWRRWQRVRLRSSGLCSRQGAACLEHNPDDGSGATANVTTTRGHPSGGTNSEAIDHHIPRRPEAPRTPIVTAPSQCWRSPRYPVHRRPSPEDYTLFRGRVGRRHLPLAGIGGYGNRTLQAAVDVKLHARYTDIIRGGRLDRGLRLSDDGASIRRLRDGHHRRRGIRGAGVADDDVHGRGRD